MQLSSREHIIDKRVVACMATTQEVGGGVGSLLLRDFINY